MSSIVRLGDDDEGGRLLLASDEGGSVAIDGSCWKRRRGDKG